MSGSGISWAICKSAPYPRHITMPESHHSVFLQARCPSFHPTNSIRALKALGLPSKICDVKVIPNVECVPKHKLLVMDMQFNTTKRGRKKSELRVCAWKLKEEKTQEYKSMARDKVQEAEWKYLYVNKHWQQMKNIMMETARVTCGCQKAHADIRKHGGGMRKLLKQ